MRPTLALLRITFVTPHQHPTSGGVYAIHQYASLLAGNHDVTMAVVAGELRELRGCSVVPVDAAPGADIVVYPADLPGMNLPAGSPVCYLQGFGAPGNPAVEANLKRSHPVVASSKWLIVEAKRRGCPTHFVPYGIDRSVFFPGRPSGERVSSLLMMTHRIDWKGTEDGLQALRMVGQQHPEARIQLFGVYEPNLEAEFVHGPERAVVAGLMREAALFVCSSWEEGFGMPGLEAMACGTALVTTDTKGSRDYAIDHESALVVPPRQPSLLADAACSLIERPETRNELAAGGLRRADLYPSWKESAGMFEKALLAVLGH